MTEKKPSAPAVNEDLLKGYLPVNAPGRFQGGYQGPTSQGAKPPTGGTSVKPSGKSK